MTGVLTALKDLLSIFFPFTGGTLQVFEVLSNGLIFCLASWCAFSFLYFIVRGFKCKK